MAVFMASSVRAERERERKRNTSHPFDICDIYLRYICYNQNFTIESHYAEHTCAERCIGEVQPASQPACSYFNVQAGGSCVCVYVTECLVSSSLTRGS